MDLDLLNSRFRPKRVIQILFGLECPLTIYLAKLGHIANREERNI